jgi:hypothetical protein
MYTHLLSVSQYAGIFLLVATMLLVAFRRIYFDAQTKKPTTFEIPIFGKVKSQSPVIVLITVGAFLVAWPIYRDRADQAVLRGTVDTGGHTVTVTVIAIPDYQATLQSSEPFSLNLPLIQDASYRVQYIVDKQIVGEQEASLKGSSFEELKPFVWVPPTASVQALAKKEISDDKLRQLGIIQ